MTSLLGLELPILTPAHASPNLDSVLRLLEIPADEADPAVLDLIRVANQWCDESITPLQQQRWLPVRHVLGSYVELESRQIIRTSPALARKLSENGPSAIIGFCYSMGEAFDARVSQLWTEEKLDESYVLRMVGVARVEEARARYTDNLIDWAGETGGAIMACDAPGYPGWPLTEIGSFVSLLNQGAADPIRCSDEGMMQPLHSIAIAFGYSYRPGKQGLVQWNNPCRGCSFRECRFRRHENKN